MLRWVKVKERNCSGIKTLVVLLDIPNFISLLNKQHFFKNWWFKRSLSLTTPCSFVVQIFFSIPNPKNPTPLAGLAIEVCAADLKFCRTPKCHFPVFPNWKPFDWWDVEIQSVLDETGGVVIIIMEKGPIALVLKRQWHFWGGWWGSWWGSICYPSGGNVTRDWRKK